MEEAEGADDGAAADESHGEVCSMEVLLYDEV